MKVTYFHRSPIQGVYSLERVFADVRKSMPAEVEYRVVASRYSGTRPDRLLYNMIEARNRQEDVNHITGDIHYIALLLDPRKTLLTIPDCVGMYRLKGLKQAAYKYLWFDLPIRRSKIVTAISAFSAGEVCRYIPHAFKKVRVVHVSVSDDFTYHSKLFDNERPIILQLGTYTNKNLNRVIEALSGIPCLLDIIGRISDEQKALLSKFRIDYTNSFNLTDAEIVQKYKDCDMVVFASTYEGFGMPIVEANATGRPVITSNICSMPEVANDAACIVNPYDVQSIRDGIIRVIQDSDYRQNLIENGLKNARRFKAENIALQYLSLYKEISAD
jgi:glycosyltransferase involved in cell wall biosynthesis